eukprot:99404_1
MHKFHLRFSSLNLYQLISDEVLFLALIRVRYHIEHNTRDGSLLIYCLLLRIVFCCVAFISVALHLVLLLEYLSIVFRVVLSISDDVIMNNIDEIFLFLYRL